MKVENPGGGPWGEGDAMGHICHAIDINRIKNKFLAHGLGALNLF